MTAKGKILDEVPTTRRPTKYDWDTPANLARLNPGKAVLAAENVRVGTISSVRGYTRSPFHDQHGDIEINMRNSRTEDGVRYGDVYFVFRPKPTESTPDSKEGNQ